MYICMSDEAGRYDGQILLKICGRLLVIDNIDDDDMYIHTYIIERWGRRTLFNHQQQHLLRNIVTIGAECLGLKIFNVFSTIWGLHRKSKISTVFERHSGERFFWLGIWN